MSKLLLIDGNSIINRAYFAIQPLNDVEGRNVNAVYGFANILFKAIKDYSPDKLVVAFDLRGHNFRKDLYPEYKANRKGMPDDLAAQMPILHQLLSLMNVTVVEKAGVEADDIIGTLSRSHDGQSFILSGDRDMFQLVSDRVTVLFTKRGVTDVESVTPTTLKENYGLTPSQVVEYKALRGDTSDNIPGVKGIGEKTAMSLLQKCGDIDELYRNLDSEKGALHEKLAQDKDMAFVSRQLARIVTDADVDCDLSHCGVYTLGEEVRQFLEKLQFRSIISRLQFEDKPQTVAAQTEKITTLAALREAVQSLLQAERTAFYYDGNVYLCGEAQKDYEVVVGDSFLDELTLSSVAECIAPLLQSDRPKAVYDVKAQRHLLSQWGSINGVKYDVCLCSIWWNTAPTRTWLLSPMPTATPPTAPRCGICPSFWTISLRKTA